MISITPAAASCLIKELLEMSKNTGWDASNSASNRGVTENLALVLIPVLTSTENWRVGDPQLITKFTLGTIKLSLPNHKRHWLHYSEMI